MIWISSNVVGDSGNEFISTIDDLDMDEDDSIAMAANRYLEAPERIDAGENQLVDINPAQDVPNRRMAHLDQARPTNRQAEIDLTLTALSSMYHVFGANSNRS